MTTRTYWLLIFGACLLSAGPTLAQSRAKQAPSISIDSLVGRDSFERYCASCHGPAGRGDGPVAAQLRQTPPDLTQFSARNGGVFPSVRLARIIDGRDVAAHGLREMPVWGDAFMALPGGTTPQQIEQRIAAIVKYLAGIQERPAE